MATAGKSMECEGPVEERIARLEVKVDHIQSDIGEVKLDVRKLNEKLDAMNERLTARMDVINAGLTTRMDVMSDNLTTRMDVMNDNLTTRIEAVNGSLVARIDAVKDAVNATQLSRAFDRVWWLLMSAALLGIMARAFKWV